MIRRGIVWKSLFSRITNRAILIIGSLLIVGSVCIVGLALPRAAESRTNIEASQQLAWEHWNRLELISLSAMSEMRESQTRDTMFILHDEAESKLRWQLSKASAHGVLMLSQRLAHDLNTESGRALADQLKSYMSKLDEESGHDRNWVDLTSLVAEIHALAADRLAFYRNVYEASFPALAKAESKEMTLGIIANLMQVFGLLLILIRESRQKTTSPG